MNTWQDIETAPKDGMGKTLPKFFYEQCCGCTNGHMASIPNNPVLFSLITAHTGGNGPYASNIPEFAEFLRDVADALAPQDQPSTTE